MPTNPKNYGQLLARTRVAKGYSQRALGKAVDVSQPQRSLAARCTRSAGSIGLIW